VLREFSAGGVVLRQIRGRWHVAGIEPRGKGPGEIKGRSKGVLALPKGLVDPGERPEEAAVREVREETGVKASMVAKLGDIKYVYTRTYSDGQRVFKIVSFFLLRYQSGKIGKIAPEMREEVSRAFWLPLEDAPRQLTYKGEAQMAMKAQEYVSAHPQLEPASKN
jgi:8-oxo-dGTP pyrophosphatase MutT (NUDIX family)